jgi:hypothetical protein
MMWSSPVHSCGVSDRGGLVQNQNIRAPIKCLRISALLLADGESRLGRRIDRQAILVGKCGKPLLDGPAILQEGARGRAGQPMFSATVKGLTNIKCW